MAKQFLQHKDRAYVRNGRSFIQVGLLSTLTSKQHPGRVIKVFAVIEEVAASTFNTAEHGQMIALSFPEEKANVKSYEWKPGEEFQVALQVDTGEAQPDMTEPEG